MKSNIVLIGFMGAGKSLVSKQLAAKLKRRCISTDKFIEEQAGKPIAEIFAEEGEEYFRKLEEAVVLEIAKKKNLIVDCGGGVVINPRNLAALKETGTVIYLAASVSEIYRRTRTQKHRPLLNVKDPRAVIKKLLEERKPFYEKADLTVNTNGKTIAQTCRAVMEALK